MKRFAMTLFAIAASLTVMMADSIAQAQSISIGGYTIRPATRQEVSNAIGGFGSIQSTNPRQTRPTARPVYNSAPQTRPAPRPVYNSAPRPRPTSRPSVTMPHSVVQPRPSVTMPHSTAGRRPVQTTRRPATQSNRRPTTTIRDHRTGRTTYIRDHRSRSSAPQPRSR